VEQPRLKHFEITDKILNAFFKRVYPALGYGFLEKVYRNALALALRQEGLSVEVESPIKIYFEGHLIGEYFADLLVENKVLVELKAVDFIRNEHEAQLLNYLRATPYEVGLLLNFGKKADFRRLVFDNGRKPTQTWEKISSM
jgi:GxxExxY protein